MPVLNTPPLATEVDRILSSGSFDASVRNRGFLKYIVDETLAGHGDRIKAYSIALTVFGRSDDFDPLLDPIVRIEAMRLRRSLDRFYLLEGSPTGFRLTIPKGRYVPSLEPITDRPADQDTGLPRVYIEDFRTEHGDHDHDLDRTIVQDLIVDISRFPNLAVFGPGSTRNVPVDYVLSGAGHFRDGIWSVTLQLLREIDQRILWARRFNLSAEQPGSAKPAAVLAAAARTLAQAYGVIFSDRAVQGSVHTVRGESSAYAAVHGFLDYWRSLDQSGIESSLAALKEAIEAEPRYAEARACLSMLYTNQARYPSIGRETARLQRMAAMRLAAEAVEIAPEGSWGYYALGLAYWFEGDIAGSMSALEHAVALNPNDMMVLAELGHRYTMLMDWDRGMPMIRAAYDAFPALPPSSHVGMFLYHLHRREFDEARASALRIYDLPIPQGPLALAVVAGERGDIREAREALARLERIRPGYAQVLEEDLLARNLHPELVKCIRVGLEKAVRCAGSAPPET